MGQLRVFAVWSSTLFICSVVINLALLKRQMMMSSTTSTLASTADDRDPIAITKEIAESRLQYWKDQIPDMVSKYTPALQVPRSDKPFVFFHNRKAGGSSLRTIIAQEAKRNGETGKKMWIPCTNKGCVPFSLPPSEGDTSIFASHINYMQMTQIMRETKARNILKKMKEPITLEKGQTVSYHKLDDSYPLFDCITNIRPTVSRVVSCWNFRMRKLRLPNSESLTPQDWNDLLPVAMDEFNNGCNNEYARIFGSTAHESEVNTLSPGKPNFLQEFDNIVSRMSRCAIVHINRCEDSTKVLHHFVPWMSQADVCGTHLNKNNRAKSTEGPSAEAAKVILEQNYMDELVFRYAEELFERQVQVALEANQTAEPP